MKYLIVGLGNPGPEYADTRHNIGFQALDALAGASSVAFSPARYGDRAELRHKGRTFILIKPATFMNLSGKAVRYWMDQENIPAERVLVITDDLALPFGAIRIKPKGGAGGHNGLKSIIEYLKSESFGRIRIGIGKDFLKGQQSAYVLSSWTVNEGKTVNEITEKAARAVLLYFLEGPNVAMNRTNS